MPNAPSSHLQAPFLRYPNGGQASPLGSMGISKIQIANRYIRAPLPLKCPPSLLHDPARVLPICLSVDEEPSLWWGLNPRSRSRRGPELSLFMASSRGKNARGIKWGWLRGAVPRQKPSQKSRNVVGSPAA